MIVIIFYDRGGSSSEAIKIVTCVVVGSSLFSVHM